ncbi:MAG: hypothetical protein HY223_09600 [Thaumarchaeota archaeon]|nr:hypothetical protein [Nitrososphaerota archaeon]
MRQTRRVMSITKSKYEYSFHTYFFKFKTTLQLLDFISKTSFPLYNSYFHSQYEHDKELILQLDERQRREYENALKFLKQRKKSRFKISDKKVQEILGAQTKMSEFASLLPQFFAEMGLEYLITKFEEFVKDELILLYTKEPRILLEKSISYVHIRGKNPKEVDQVFMKKQARDLISGGIEEVTSHLKKKTKLDLESHKDWKKFAERFYRRNVIIHLDGYPDEIYFQKTGRKKQNIRLSITNNYLKESINLLDDIGHTITDFLEQKYGVKKFHKTRDVFMLP